MTTAPSPRAGVPNAVSDLARRHQRVTRRLTTGHAALMQVTRGRVAGGWFGTSLLLLQTIGRRSGRLRSAPLVYLPDGDDLVVVASDAGAHRPPAWSLNLLSAGEAVALVDGDRVRVTPTVTRGAHRERLWRQFAAVSPIEHYQRRCPRPLSIITLTPQPVRYLSWAR